jgi:hypothetical protein
MKKKAGRISRGRAIKEYCFECSGDNPSEVLLCHLEDCPLWAYRTSRHEERLKLYLAKHPEIGKDRKESME